MSGISIYNVAPIHNRRQRYHKQKKTQGGKINCAAYRSRKRESETRASFAGTWRFERFLASVCDNDTASHTDERVAVIAVQLHAAK